jgi:hypothetical protein
VSAGSGPSTPDALVAALRRAVDGPARSGGAEPGPDSAPDLGIPAALDSAVVLDVPGDIALADLVAAVSRWAGAPRNLAADGFTDTSLGEATGLPLVEPFGAGLLEMRAWGRRAYWIGCGLVAGPGAGSRTVAVLAPRRDPAAEGFPAGVSWTEKLCLLTGHLPGPVPRVDWAAVEAELGTTLPTDYRQIVDVFGAGSFDWYVDLLVPGLLGGDLLVESRWDAENAGDMFRPYAAYPAPQGLLRWGGSEQEIVFCWQTGAGSPDDWPVLVQSDFVSWTRYDCGIGEFLVRLLADVAFGFPTSRVADHCFVSHLP